MKRCVRMGRNRYGKPVCKQFSGPTMTCQAYGRSPSGRTRCAIYGKGSGAPSEATRRAAGLVTKTGKTRRYTYKPRPGVMARGTLYT